MSNIYWTFIANSNYTLLNLEHDSTRLFWPTIGMSVSDSLCPGPLRAGGEFNPILVQITTMNHDDNIFSAVIKGLSTMNQIFMNVLYFDLSILMTLINCQHL